MAAKTTFVLVPGAWHPAACFDALTGRLQDLGYPLRLVNHKSVGAEPPLKSFDPDVEQVRDVIEQEADKEQDIVVFMHSYGGMVGTEACRGLDKKARAAVGKEGGIVRLIYCCAFMVPEGVCLYEAIGSRPAPWITLSDNDTRADVEDPNTVFYNDMTAEHAEDIKKHLKHQSYQTFMSKLTYAAYRDIPTTYILCTKDNAIPFAGQEAMVEQARKSGVQIQTRTLQASHSPFCSVPDEVAAICQTSVE